MTAERRYWDSCAFLGYLGLEEDIYDGCREVLDLADRGSIEIVTSALTIAEVLHARGEPRVKPEDRDTVRQMMRRKFLKVRAVDRRTSELAQDLYWQESVEPKDAIHVATALLAEVPILETKDRGLLDKTGLSFRELGPLKIRRPQVEQQTLDLDHP